jgi:hypothetical protein
MSRAAQALISAFGDLEPTDKAEVISELLRQAAQQPHDLPSDEEFVAAADGVFSAYDQEENARQ